MPSQADKDIIVQLKDPSHREAAFGELMSRYQERLYWHCRKILMNHDDANDALQNTFLKAWKYLVNFREDSGLFTWLFRIATNESLTLLKQRKRQFNSPDNGEYENHLSDSLISDPWFDGDELQMKLQLAILALPEKQRLVFNMKYFDEMKYDEMSEVLETSVGALKASYHHAVKKIEKYLTAE